MWTLKLLSWIALALLLAYGVGWMVFSGGGSIACGKRTVLVTGRLIDAQTMQPISGAYVMSLALRDWANDQEVIERYRAWNRDDAPRDAALISKGYWRSAGSMNPSTTTTQDGTFQLVLSVSCSTICSGFPRRCVHSGDEPRHGAEVLRVELQGREPILLDVPHGTWDESRRDEGLYAVWGWGDLAVP